MSRRTLTPGEKVVRVNISTPATYAELANQRAASMGLTLSEWTRQRWFAPVGIAVVHLAPIGEMFVRRAAKVLDREPASLDEVLRQITDADAREAVARILTEMEWEPVLVAEWREGGE